MDLQICFNNKGSYKRAVEFVDKISVFYAEPNDEWQMLVVECSDQLDLDNNKQSIESELIENGFENFYFEIEN